MAQYFEDFKKGDVIVTRGRTVTEADIMQYAGLCWDTQREHTNIEFAKKTAFGGRIGQQQLGMLIAHGLMHGSRTLDTTLASVLRLEWHYLNPIKIGDTLHVKFTVVDTKESSVPKTGMVIFDFETINQRNEIVHQCRRYTLVARKPAAQDQSKDRCAYAYHGLSDLEPEHARHTNPTAGASEPSAKSHSKAVRPANQGPKGKYYEEFELGEELVTEARTVAEADVINYTMLSWDNDALHTDAEFGRRSAFGGMVAPLLLPIVFANGLGATLGYLAGTNRGALGDWWEFVAPVRIGDTLRFRQIVVDSKDAKDPKTGIVTWSMEMVNQNDAVVSRGERSSLVQRVPQGEPDPDWKFVFGTVGELSKEQKS
jgi:3-hydroxybutyryl-CoA dehydratase